MNPKLEKALEYTHYGNWVRTPDFYDHELTFEENFQRFKTAIDLLAKEKRSEKWMAYKVNAANTLSKILIMQEFQMSRDAGVIEPHEQVAGLAVQIQEFIMNEQPPPALEDQFQDLNINLVDVLRRAQH
ncbi:hypothetical protein BGZ52_010002 [Haplosporangium bisporale]|nr:hypothetical protein BGZ52_010002 [Haplosporangium bisporale]